MRRTILCLTVLIGFYAPFTAHAEPYDCGSASPRRVREIFETSPYAQRHKLKAELPVITKHRDGKCTAAIKVLDWESNLPTGELNLDLVVVYYACQGGDITKPLPATAPDACPWLNLRNYPLV